MSANTQLDSSSDLRSLLRFLSRPEEGDRDIQRFIDNGISDAPLRRLASAHKVGPLLALLLEKAYPEWYASENAAWLRQEARNNRIIAEILASECVRLTQGLLASGIDVTSYKGVALSALLFGDEGTRVSGDIDLIVCENRVADASRCLCSLGYEPTMALDEKGLEEWMRCLHGRVFQGPGGWPRVDLQWRIVRSTTIAISGDPELLLQHRQSVRLAKGTVQILSLEANLIALSVHGAKHSWQQLRWVCDLGQILTDPRLDAPLAVQLADQMGLQRVLAVGVTQVRRLLDVPVPAPLARSIDRQGERIADRMREGMFASDEPHWGGRLSVITWFLLRERWRDRLAGARAWLARVLRPNQRDYAVFPLPRRLSFLYYAIRPFRLAKKHGGRIRQKPS
jgi:hypothetical protein